MSHTLRSLAVLPCISAGALGCSTETPGEDGGPGMDAESPADAALDAGDSAPPDARAPIGPDGAMVMPDDGGTPDAGCGCDDGVACTRDVCLPGGACMHNTAEHIACPAGQYCGATGCVDGPACASEADCPHPDPCLIVFCNAARGVCEYNLIDNDGDGFAPVSCGGTDCDDSDATISPESAEQCDGVDQDCDTRIDEDYLDSEGASVSLCERGYVCAEALCTCPAPLTECPAWTDPYCADLQTDRNACGACGEVCSANETCVAGECVCDVGLTQCGAGCVDLTTDRDHCGACGYGCEHGCVAGTCECPAGEALCDPAPGGGRSRCVEVASEATDCGACGVACLSDAGCNAGVCEAVAGGAVAYGASGAYTVSSPLRAGFAHVASTGASVLHIPFYGADVHRYEGTTRTPSFATVYAGVSLRQHLVSVGADLSHRWETRASTGHEAALAVDAAGDVYLAGRYDDGAVIGVTPFTVAAGAIGGIVAKLDGATSALLWSKTITDETPAASPPAPAAAT